MKLEELISKTGRLPCFTTGFLAACQSLPQLRLQLGRWCKTGKVLRLTRGVYCLAEPYRKCKVEPFAIANSLKKPSCVSLQSALAWHGLIPEFVPQTTSVTTGRPGVFDTPLGRFSYRHLARSKYWACETIDSADSGPMIVAKPEKALLDLVYLTPGGAEMSFLTELRLQNTERIDIDTLGESAKRFGSPKMQQACENIERIIAQDKGVEL